LRGNGHVSAHIGVGCIVRLDRPTIVDLYATRDSLYSYIVASRGISETSEGGLEMTFMRGNQVLEAGTLPLWHSRASAFEEHRDETSFSRDPG
jgi:hypothetical protein